MTETRQDKRASSSSPPATTAQVRLAASHEIKPNHKRQRTSGIGSAWWLIGFSVFIGASIIASVVWLKFYRADALTSDARASCFDSDFVERHETLNRQPPVTVNNVLEPTYLTLIYRDASSVHADL